MPKTRVVLNNIEFGRQVMAAGPMADAMRSIAAAVANDIPGAEIDTVVRPVQRGGSRVRARVSHGTDKHEADTGELLSALRSKVGGKRV
jgi:hypothetical protein